MTLRINAMYKTATGFIVPRSRLSDAKGVKWACVDVITQEQGGKHYTKVSTTMTTKEIKKTLGLGRTEGVEII